MSSPPSASIDKRLSRLFSLAITFCLVVTSVGFAAALLYYSHRTFTQELSSVTNVIASASRAAVIFDDKSAGDRILSGLGAKPSITYAALLDASGNLLSERGSRPAEVSLTPAKGAEESNWFWSFVTLSVPVVVDAEQVGTLVVVSSLGTLYEQLYLFAVIAICILMVAMCGTLYFSRLLRRLVSEPVVSLSELAKKVSLTKDFSTRLSLPSSTQDEISQLIRTFNEMLEQLEERDRALVLAKNRAEEAGRIKSVFLATVSHELRTPLHAILGMTEEVLHTEVSSEQKELLEIVRNAGSLLISIINDILDFSKIEAGKLYLNPSRVVLHDFLYRVLRMFELAAKKKGVSLDVTISDDVPATIYIDESRLAQVLVNLVGNALKFTEQGAIQIRVAAKKFATTNGFHFTVVDSGVGIPEKHLNSIFDSFTQVHGLEQPKEGTGLGLAISSRLVNLMGGSIWAESVEKVGSRFHFVLQDAIPVNRSTELESSPADKKAVDSKPAPDPTTASGYTVLVVEDNQVNSKLAERVLTKAGYRVLLAQNGLEGIEAIEREQIDVVLMDVNMPVMDGVTATRKIREGEREGRRRVSIIALTANAVDDQFNACAAAGMDEFLSKPLDRTTLLSTVARFLPGSPTTIVRTDKRVSSESMVEEHGS